MSRAASVAGMYDETTFDRNLLPSFLKKDAREVIEVAVMFGWKVHISSANSVTIVSPEERKKYHFSISGRSSTSISRMRRDVVRFADPQKLLIADSILGVKDQDMQAVAMALLPHVGDTGTVVDHRPELEEEAKRMAQEKAERKAEADKQKAEEKKGRGGDASGHTAACAARPSYGAAVTDERRCTCKKVEGPALVAKAKHIVSSRPMLAKASEGRGYESRVAVERTWSDGSTDYKCVECDFSNENRLAVRGHYSSHRKGQQPVPETFHAEVPKAATYSPNKNRVAALAEVLTTLLQGEATPEDVAREALTWVGTQSRQRTRFSEDYEPMTADETLARIKTLLDDGSHFQIIEQNRELAERVAALETAKEAAEQKAAKARADLRTFVELASGLADEEQEAS